MRKLRTLVIIAVIAMIAFPVQVASQSTSQTTVSVEVRVLPYVFIDAFEDELVMNPVTGDMFEAGLQGEKRKTFASTGLEAWGTVPMQLKAPLTVVLSDGGTYQAEVDVSVWGENVKYTQDVSFQYIDLDPGLRYDLTLQVKIDKVWGPGDMAGTFTGTVTLKIYSI